MIPDGAISTEPIIGTIVGGRANTSLTDPTEDYESGGTALDDASAGLQVRTWRAYIEDGEAIYIDAVGIAPVLAYEGESITQVSLAFDQNMRYALAIVEAGVAKLNWYDTTIPGRTTLTFAGAASPRICMDDKRALATGENDILLAYVKNGKLYHRLQRDRFTIEYWLFDLPEPATHRLKRIGMNDGLRLQFEF
jgi:hypothetical protein